MQGEIFRRSRMLLVALVGEVPNVGEIRLPDLLELVSEIVDGEGRRKWSPKTVDNAYRDLVAFGALRSVQRGRDRLVSHTILGLAWKAGISVPTLADMRGVEAAFEQVIMWFDESDEVVERAILDEVEDWAPELTDEQMAELEPGFAGHDRARQEAEAERAAMVARIEQEGEEIASALSEHLPEGYEASFDSRSLLE